MTNSDPPVKAPRRKQFGVRTLLRATALIAIVVRCVMLLDTRAAIIGTVVGAKNSRPITGVNVTVVSTIDGESWDTKTDALGNFGFPKMPKGRYWVIADSDDWAFSYRDCLVDGRASNVVEIRQFRLSPGAKIDLIVTGEEMLPRKTSVVSIQRELGGPSIVRKSNNGSFQFRTPPGRSMVHLMNGKYGLDAKQGQDETVVLAIDNEGRYERVNKQP